MLSKITGFYLINRDLHLVSKQTLSIISPVTK